MTLVPSTIRALTVSAFLGAAACSTYDESEGTFVLSASGGLDAVTRGRVRAYYLPVLNSTANAFLIVLELDSASPPLVGFNALNIMTEQRPTDNARYVHSLTGPSDAMKTALVGLSEPSGVTIEWDTDSATVDFKTVRGRHGVAGDFTLYLSCDAVSRRRREDAPSFTVASRRTIELRRSGGAGRRLVRDGRRPVG
jgi:hypothetical protein